MAELPPFEHNCNLTNKTGLLRLKIEQYPCQVYFWGILFTGNTLSAVLVPHVAFNPLRLRVIGDATVGRVELWLGQPTQGQLLHSATYTY